MAIFPYIGYVRAENVGTVKEVQIVLFEYPWVQGEPLMVFGHILHLLNQHIIDSPFCR